MIFQPSKMKLNIDSYRMKFLKLKSELSLVLYSLDR